MLSTSPQVSSEAGNSLPELVLNSDQMDTSFRGLYTAESQGFG